MFQAKYVIVWDVNVFWIFEVRRVENTLKPLMRKRASEDKKKVALKGC